MLNVRQAGDHLVHLAVAGDVFDGVFLCRPFFHEMSWMGSGTWLSQFLRSEGFPTYFCDEQKSLFCKLLEQFLALHLHALWFSSIVIASLASMFGVTKGIES